MDMLIFMAEFWAVMGIVALTVIGGIAGGHILYARNVAKKGMAEIEYWANGSD